MDEMSCHELVEQITDYMEGALGSADSARLDQHLHDCIGCRAYLGEMEMTVQVASSLPPEPLSTELEAELFTLYREWLERVTP